LDVLVTIPDPEAAEMSPEEWKDYLEAIAVRAARNLRSENDDQ